MLSYIYMKHVPFDLKIEKLFFLYGQMYLYYSILSCEAIKICTIAPMYVALINITYR